MPLAGEPSGDSAPGGALDGVLVLDLSRVFAGPYAVQMLGDLGAEVIKVEHPRRGDDTRYWPPGRDGESSYYLAANRNKRGVTLDLATPQGADAARELAERADVLVENFKPGAMNRFGLDYESLRATNPGLVYCSITAFGADGPYRDRPGYDFVLQAMTGFMSLTGPVDGPGYRVGVPVVDLACALHATSAILAALFHRTRTGDGQLVELSLFDAAVSSLANAASSYLVTGAPPPRTGNAHPSVAPYEAFTAADGDVVLAVGNDAQFRRFCEIAQVPELAADPRFAANADRVSHREELAARIQAVLTRRTRAEWMDALGDDVAIGPVNDIAELFADEHLRARGLVASAEHPTLGRLDYVPAPARFSATPMSTRRPPPRQGEHTREVLASVLGWDDRRIDALVAAATPTDQEKELP